MKLSAEELRRLERVHVRAWPALRSERIQGWLWRYSGGASQRANSVSAIEFDGADAKAAIDEIEQRYREQGAPARLHSFSVCQPANLTDLLMARGYRETEATTTMAKRLGAEAPQADGVEIATTPSAAWLEVYLGAITESRRAVNTVILEKVPEPRAFFAYRQDGQVVSTALCVVEPDAEGGFGVIECVATRLEARRQGGARKVLAAIEAWAAGRRLRLLGLQVSQTNPPAVALYERLGFVAVDANRFWIGG